MAKMKQLTVTVENRPGAVSEIAKALGNAKVNMLRLGNEFGCGLCVRSKSSVTNSRRSPVLDAIGWCHRTLRSARVRRRCKSASASGRR